MDEKMFLVWRRHDYQFMGIHDEEELEHWRKRDAIIVPQKFAWMLGIHGLHVQIDWDMLNAQKKSLLAVIEVLDNNDSLFDGLEGFDGDPVPSAGEAYRDLTGILHMIDALQDVAVDTFGVWEFPEGKD